MNAVATPTARVKPPTNRDLVLAALVEAGEPQSSNDILARIDTIESQTTVCKELYALRQAGAVEIIGSANPGRNGRAMNLYLLTPKGFALHRGEDAPAAAAMVTPSAPKPPQEPQPPAAPPTQAPGPVLAAIAGLAPPLAQVGMADVERLVALAGQPLCRGAVGDWLRDLARRLSTALGRAPEVQP